MNHVSISEVTTLAGRSDGPRQIADLTKWTLEAAEHCSGFYRNTFEGSDIFMDAIYEMRNNENGNP